MSYMFATSLHEAEKNISLSALNGWNIRNVSNFTGMFNYHQGDRDSIYPGSSVNDITFPTFTLRPGVWSISEAYAGSEIITYVPND